MSDKLKLVKVSVNSYVNPKHVTGVYETVEGEVRILTTESPWGNTANFYLSDFSLEETIKLLTE
jgi:hypothetical protein